MIGTAVGFCRAGAGSTLRPEFDALPITNRRYRRLEICATSPYLRHWALSVCGSKYADVREMGITATRSVWSASSSLALSSNAATPKAGASSTHSKRFAPRSVCTAPKYVTGLTFQGTTHVWRFDVTAFGVEARLTHLPEWDRRPSALRRSYPGLDYAIPSGLTVICDVARQRDTRQRGA